MGNFEVFLDQTWCLVVLLPKRSQCSGSLLGKSQRAGVSTADAQITVLKVSVVAFKRYSK